VLYESKGQGPDNLTSIPLDQVSSSNLGRRGDITLPIAAGVLLVASGILFVFSLILLLFYIASFKYVLEVTSSGSRIRVLIAKNALEGAVDFMHELDVARSDLLAR